MVILSILPTAAVRSPSPSAESSSEGAGRSRGTDTRSGGNSNSNTISTPSTSKLPNRQQQQPQQKLMNNATQGWSGKPAASSLLLNPTQDAGRAGASDSTDSRTAEERRGVGVGAAVGSFVSASSGDRGPDTGGGLLPGSATDSSASDYGNDICARAPLDGAGGNAGCFVEDDSGGGGGLLPPGGGQQEESYLDDIGAEDDISGRSSGGGGGGSVLVEGDSRDSGGSGGDTSDNSENSLGAGMTEPKGVVVAGSGLPPPPPIRAPSAFSTPDGSPRHPRGGRGGGGDVFVSPMGSPWPTGGLGSASREAGGAAAAGDRFCRGRMNKPWKAGDNNQISSRSNSGVAGGGVGGGEVVSPISVAACSTPRTMVSPRHALTTPRFSAAVVAATATAAATVTAASGTVGGRSMRGFSAGLDPDSIASAAWWGELDLSPPPRLDYPDGILKWSDSRKPSASTATASTTTRSTTGSSTATITGNSSSDSNSNSNCNSNSSPGGSPERHASATPNRPPLLPSASTAAATEAHGVFSACSPSSSGLTRSYVTLIAAAGAAAATGVGVAGKGIRSNSVSGSSGSSLFVGMRTGGGGGGVSERGRLVGRGKKGMESSAATGGGGGSCGVSEEGSFKERARQLELENLRLRFRVADLEGQVSAMEDELEQKSRQAVMETRLPRSAAAGGKASSSTPERAENGNDSVGELDVSPEGVDLWSGMGGKDSLLSPRERGYLAQLVLDVCAEIEESKKAVEAKKTETGRGGTIPQSDRLCKVLPMIMESAIRGVKDLNDQVFEQMMQAAQQQPQPQQPQPQPLTQHPPPPSLGTPARRLSSCVVARDGGGTEFFAASPAPSHGRHAFFRGINGTSGVGNAKGLGSTNEGSTRTAPPTRELHSGGKALGWAVRAPETPVPPPPLSASSSSSSVLGGGVSNGAGGAERPKHGGRFLGAGDWITAAFTPRGVGSCADKFDVESPRAANPPTSSKADTAAALATPTTANRHPETQEVLSFEGSTEEVLRYTIVAKSYLIRSRSKKREDDTLSPSRGLKSPKTSRRGDGRGLEDGDKDEVRDATKELLELKNRYMTATQHWLKTDIVNVEELRMIRSQVFDAIQKKRSELHKEAAAVLRSQSHRTTDGGGGTPSPKRRAGKPPFTPSDPNQKGGSSHPSANEEGEAATRTISMLSGTAELLRYSRLLLLLSEAISASSTVTGGGSSSVEPKDNNKHPSSSAAGAALPQALYSYTSSTAMSASRRHTLLASGGKGGDFVGASPPPPRPPSRGGISVMTPPLALRKATAQGVELDGSPE